ncbi:MAG TPA: G5 domain-containing protein [Verrucomicrobiae bacterium]|nr:G5 domain-containing protein [Verrucomicrobiae bacterium]
MFSIFVLLFLLAIIGLIWGLIAPHHIAKITPGRRELTRTQIGLLFPALAFVLLILAGITAPLQKTVNVQQTSLKTNTTQSPSSSTTKPPAKPKAPTVTTKQETETQTVAYTTQNQNDSSLTKGQTKVAQQGQNGNETLMYKVTYTNGQQTSKTLVSTAVTTQPVTQIVDVGTYVAPTPAPTVTTTPTPTPTPAPTQSCYPLSSENTCYEPGEYCRDSDHGTSGLAGDGESITCEDNNGWRWEPV